MAEIVRLHLDRAGLDSVAAHTGQGGLEAVASGAPDLVVLDLDLPDLGGLQVLRLLQEQRPDLPVVMLTGESEIEPVVRCMQAGAVDYIQKPFDQARLVTSIQNALRHGRLMREVMTLRNELRREGALKTLVGQSPALEQSKSLLSRAASSDVTVLIQGESGTGKEVAARALHEQSGRATGPFIAINCGAIPENLVESELFGHEKGAFTGADSRRSGCFEEAVGGTLFLDEIGELAPAVQVRLLRVLQEKQIQRVGSNQTIPVDVRIIAATNRNLRTEVDKGNFREDLFYRVSVFPVELPPLRDRGEDALLLADCFLHRFGEDLGRTFHGFSVPARKVLLEYSWPGNVRELINVVNRAVLLSDDSVIRIESIDPDLVASCFGSDVPSDDSPVIQEAPIESDGESLPLGEDVLTWKEYERRILQHALERHEWRVREVAEVLGIGRATLYRKIELYELTADKS